MIGSWNYLKKVELKMEINYSLLSANANILIVDDTIANLTLLDITIPEMDGYEVCRQLQMDSSVHSHKPKKI